jgi:hypothetical protein
MIHPHGVTPIRHGKDIGILAELRPGAHHLPRHTFRDASELEEALSHPRRL